MTRSTTSLHRHLLTRSDLAHLQVPAGDVLTWLAEGMIEQVGELSADDPVFMVPSAELRRQLTPRLAAIGKSTVVLTPLRVRSLLMRALLANDAPAATSDQDVAANTDDIALVTALQSAAAEIEADVEVMLRLAAEEARLEQLEQVEAAADTDSTAGPAATAQEPALPSDGEPASAAEEPAPESTLAAEPDADPLEDEECFEFDDLTSALDALLPDAPVAAEVPCAPADNETDHVEPLSTEPTMPVEADPSHDSAHLDAIRPAAEEPETPPRLPTGAEVAAVLDLFETKGEPTPPTAATEAEVEPAPEPDHEPEAVFAPPDVESAPPMPLPTPPPTTVPTPVAGEAIERVESFLAQLKDTLVELAQRPAPAAPVAPPPTPPLDVTPLVLALQQGFERSHQQAEAAKVAITTLGERVAALGPDLQAIATRPIPAPPPPAAPAASEQRVERPMTEFVVARTSRAPVVLLALAAMVVAWSVLFWVKTGSMKLALGTLIAGNLVGCSLIAFGRQR
ncbi:MAG: hypothetical protein JNK15_21600 [Planctomycetes bacterium]|nr:hypothetical protein [Planctomycetota bacterium]